MSDFIPRGCAPLRDWLEAQSRERLPARWAFIEKCRVKGRGGLLALELSAAQVLALSGNGGGKLACQALKDAPFLLAQRLQSKHLLHEFSAVRESLYAGEVGAVAIADDGSIGAIPSVFWGGPQAFGVVETGRRDGRRVLIRDCEKGKNRTVDMNAERSERSNARVIKAATDFLITERDTSPDWQPHSKKDYFSLMLAKFPGLTPYGARQAWKAASEMRPAHGWGLKGNRSEKRAKQSNAPIELKLN